MIGDEGLQILKTMLDAQSSKQQSIHENVADIPELEEIKNFETLQQRNEEITRFKDEDYRQIKQNQNQEYISNLFNTSH